VKAFVAALVAAAVLYVVDSQYNDGRYTQVLQHAELSLKVGDGGNRKGGISWGCLTPPLLHRRSDMLCPKITPSG
jgi:hypothetical protein